MTTSCSKHKSPENCSIHNYPTACSSHILTFTFHRTSGCRISQCYQTEVWFVLTFFLCKLFKRFYKEKEGWFPTKHHKDQTHSDIIRQACSGLSPLARGAHSSRISMYAVLRHTRTEPFIQCMWTEWNFFTVILLRK